MRLARYPAFLSEPAALSYVFELVGALAVYVAAVFALPFVAARFPGAPIAVSVGAIAGLIGGITEMASMTLESLVTLPQLVVTVTTGAAMLGLFLLFGVAGFLGGRRTGSFWLGLGTAIWSAMVAILFTVTFGFLLVNTSLLKLAHDEIGDPDYLRSGWTDVRAYAIANTFDAGFTHLVEAPVIAAALGVAGGGIGRLAAKRRPAPQG